MYSPQDINDAARYMLSGIQPTRTILDELIPAPAQYHGTFLMLPAIESLMYTLSLSLEQVCTLTYEQFAEVCSQQSMAFPSTRFDDAIREIVQHYRGTNYGAVDRRIRDHRNRNYTFQQVEYYERKLAETGEVETAIEYSQNIIASSSPPVIYPNDVSPSDANYRTLAMEMISRYRYRGEPESLKSKAVDHQGRGFTIRQVERYEAHYNQYSNMQEAINFARGTDEIPATWLKEPMKPIEPKKVLWKDVFLSQVFPQGAPKKLLSKVATLTEKADILKAVFIYNNPKKQRKIRAFRPNGRFLAKLREHNSADHAAIYLARLEQFYRGIDARRNHGNDLVRYCSSMGKIARPVLCDELVLTHSLFMVEKCGEDRKVVYGQEHYNKGFRLIVTTRNDVYYSYLGQRMNFGKLCFNVNLRDQSIVSIKLPENFQDNVCPYISNESRVCMGNNERSIRDKLAAGQISEALNELYLTMTNFNPDSTPYAGLDHYFEKANLGSLKRNNGEKPEIEVII